MANSKKIIDGYERRQRQLFSELRLNGYNQTEVGEALGRSQAHISKCIRGLADWTVCEAYTLLRMAGIENERFMEFFPPRKVGAR